MDLWQSGFHTVVLAVFPFLAVSWRSLAEEKEVLKRLMGSPDKSAETASIIRISYTYQNDSLHLRKKTVFWGGLCSLYDSTSVLSPSGECLASSEVAAEVPGWLGRSRAPPCTGATPATAFTAEGQERWHSHSQLPFHKTKKDLHGRRPNFNIWGKSYQKCIWTGALCSHSHAAPMLPG